MLEQTLASEKAFLVRERDVALGRYPTAEPVILVDLSLAHRYPGVRYVTLVDAPAEEDAGPRLGLQPILVINLRQAVLYEGARPATIVEDLRTETGDAELPREGLSLTA